VSGAASRTARGVRVVLWDIDGTLLRSEGAGREAMSAAGLRMIGRPFDLASVSTSGRLDPLIWRDIASAHGIRDGDAREAEFHAAYREQLHARFTRSVPRRLPGTAELIARLQQIEGIAQGLLTGNYADTGTLKLRLAGLAPEHFRFHAWGDDASCRADLLPVALARAQALLGHALAAADAIVIGDTPHDVACARAHGARALAVATGAFGLEELKNCGADGVLADLSDTDAVLAWIGM
jgi:phosphoglycolate phosphatase